MLHSKVYNTALTEDIRTAYLNNDLHFLQKEVVKLCSVVANRQFLAHEHDPYDAHFSRLLICMALVDAMTRHTETVQFITDMLNF